MFHANYKKKVLSCGTRTTYKYESPLPVLLKASLPWWAFKSQVIRRHASSLGPGLSFIATRPKRYGRPMMDQPTQSLYEHVPAVMSLFL